MKSRLAYSSFVDHSIVLVVCMVLSLSLAAPGTVYGQDPGKALQFNGSSNYVNIGDKSALKPTTEITVEAWFNAEAQGNYASILSNVFDTQLIESGYCLALDGLSGVSFGLTTLGGGMYYLEAPNSITLNKWYHIAGTYDGATMRLYVDGVLKASQTKSGNLDYDPANPMTFGLYKDDNETYYFKGKVDEIRIWNVTRTQQQIQTDRLRQLNGNETGLIGYWRFNEGTGTTTNDATSNANHGTIFGASWIASGAFGGGVTTGTLTGKVTNALTGLAISGATVSIAGRTGTTGTDGSYTITNVPVGTLDANFTASPTSGTAPLTVQFTDLSTEGMQSVSASATGYMSYSNNQVVITGGVTTTLNISLSPTITGNALRIVLNWGSTPADLDSHLRTPSIGGSTYHVYFGDKGSATGAPYAILDHDETSGYGPETITISQFYTGTYKYYVHRYSSDGSLPTSGAVVQIYGSTGLLRTFQVPTTGSGDYWYVCDIDGTTRSVTSVNRIQSSEVLSLGDIATSRIEKPAKPLLRSGGESEHRTAALTYSWDFGDNTAFSTSQNPSHVYQSAGTYTVRLIVTSGTAKDTLTKTGYIQVNAATGSVGTLAGKVTSATTGLPIAGAVVSCAGRTAISGSDGAYVLTNVPVGMLRSNFSATPTSGSAPLSVQFTDLSTEGTQTVSATATGYTSYSNSQVVITSSGTTQLNISLSPTLTGSSLRLVLNWGSTPQDLDSHLRTPAISGSTYHVYFGNKGNSTSAPYAVLDHDETSGYGPETITISQFFTGTYKYYVHRYSTEATLPASGAVVQIYDASGLIRTFQVPTSGTGDYWYVCDIDGTTKAITGVNRIQSAEVLSLQDIPAAGEHKQISLQRNSGSQGGNSVAAFAYNWSFGDGTSSTSQNPLKTYQNVGSYTVRLIVTSGSRSDTLTRTNYITVGTTSVRYATSVLGFSSQYGTGAWAAAQLLGPPNVYPLYGDIGEAWASSSMDNQREYLELGFSNPAPVSSIAIWETYNPGAVDTIYVKNPNTNQWDKVWSGTASVKPAVSRIFSVNFALTSYNVSQVRIAINSPAVPSWNEIDAVGISNLPITSVEEGEALTSAVPTEFVLLQNYPNPFNPSTRIRFAVPERGRVVVKVVSVLGQEIATLMDDVAEPGRWYVKSFDAAGLPSGIYFATVEAGGKRLVQKMVLMK